MARHYSIHHVQGTHLTLKDREMIQTVYNNNLRLPLKDRQSLRSLAKTLGLSVSTLHREVKRGMVSTPNTFNGQDIWDYSALKAQDGVDAGNMNRGCAMKMTTEMARLLRELIVGQGRSPFDARCKLLGMGLPWVPSESTIYNHIEHGDMGIFHGQTPYHPSKRRRPTKQPRRPLRNPGSLSIEDRPDISARTEFGHWEMDTIVSCVGGRGGLLVLVERHSRFYIMEKIDAISQDAVAHALHRMLRSGTMKKVLSITTDNGSEFLDSDRLTHVLGKHHPEASIYYTHAYASWEKGSVENTNRMARRWYPKGTDFSRVAKERVKALQDFINSIARKTSLKGKTAHEVFSTAA